MSDENKLNDMLCVGLVITEDTAFDAAIFEYSKAFDPEGLIIANMEDNMPEVREDDESEWGYGAALEGGKA